MKVEQNPKYPCSSLSPLLLSGDKMRNLWKDWSECARMRVCACAFARVWPLRCVEVPRGSLKENRLAH